ncbi:MAG: hypothetical protein AUK49_08660 [Betaproteobacteria bacterium CG2_30_68_42]|nr:MAG: hypothetical protein AUK49_08660 [Betaproteobacteria bacterium CG2_30_68_42]
MTSSSYLRRTTTVLLLAAVLAGCGDSPEKQIASAKAEMAKKDYRAAAIRLKGVLQKDENLAEARYLLGRAGLETGDTATAEKHLRKAVELGYDAEQSVPELARAMIELGQHKKVLSEFAGRKLASPQGRAGLLVSIAWAQLASREADAARKSIADALAAKPDHPRALLASAWMKAQDKDVRGAETIIDAVLAREADSIEALGMKASLALARGDRENAIKAYRRITEVRPAQIAAHYGAYTLLMQENKVAEAKAQIESLRKVAPKHPMTSYLQALMAYREKDLPAARDRVAETLKFAPDFLPALMFSGLINTQLRNYELAEQHLNKVLAQVPNSFFAKRTLIGVLVQTGRADRAVELAQEMVRQAPENAEVLSMAASTYMLAGDAKQGAALFEKAARLAPKDAKKRTGLALAHFAAGEATQALQDLEAASAEDASSVDADVLLVLQHLRAKRFDKAIEAAAVIEKKAPDSPATHNLKGRVLAAAGKPARASFERALQLKPDFVPALVNLGRIDLIERKPEAARKRFEDAIAKWPKNVALQIAHVDALNAMGAPREEIRKVLERTVAAAPADAGARRVLIAFHVRGKEFDLALKAAQEAAAAIPGNAGLLRVLGELQLATGAADQAVATFTRAVEISPNSIELLLRLSDARTATGATEAALQSLRKALALKPDLRDAQIRIASIQSRSGHTADAVKVARDMQQRQPKDAVGYLLEGDLYAREKKWNEAVAAYRTGMERTKAPLLAVRLHQSLSSAQRKQEADKLAADWVRANPKDGYLRNYLAERAQAAGDAAEAARQYKALHDQFPQNQAILNNLAWASYEAKDAKALGYAEQANKLAPGNPAVMDTLGWILVEKGDPKRGIELLQQAVAKAPKAAELRLHLAKAMIRDGRKDEARKELAVLSALGDKYPKQAEVAKLKAGL